jgi:hypothetical protein
MRITSAFTNPGTPSVSNNFSTATISCENEKSFSEISVTVFFLSKKLCVKKLFDRSRHLYSSDTPVLSLKRIKLTKTTGATIALFNYRKIVLVDNWEINPITFETVEQLF